MNANKKKEFHRRALALISGLNILWFALWTVYIEPDALCIGSLRLCPACWGAGSTD
jgi:hypothetical protein